MSKATFMLGFIAGLTSPTMAEAKGQPVAYLYTNER